jgi:hypothetical protein
VPYHALVHARSNLRLRATIAQSETTPGGTVFLRAVITEYGQPLGTHPRVFATVTRPDRTTAQLVLSETTAVEFEASAVAAQAGVYRFYIQAHGFHDARATLLTRTPALCRHRPRTARSGGSGARQG